MSSFLVTGPDYRNNCVRQQNLPSWLSLTDEAWFRGYKLLQCTAHGVLFSQRRSHIATLKKMAHQTSSTQPTWGEAIRGTIDVILVYRQLFLSTRVRRRSCFSNIFVAHGIGTTGTYYAIGACRGR